jgi:hypothetical protein
MADGMKETPHGYYNRYRYQIATSEVFLNAVADVTGDGHRDLYDKWIGGHSER